LTGLSRDINIFFVTFVFGSTTLGSNLGQFTGHTQHRQREIGREWNTELKTK